MTRQILQNGATHGDIRSALNSMTGDLYEVPPTTPQSLRKAFAAYKAQIDDLVCLFVGTSTFRGFGSTVGQPGTTTANRYEWALTRRLRDMLVKRGEFATADAILGNGEQGDTLEQYNSRFTESPANSWSQTSGVTLGGHAFRAGTVGAKWQLAAGRDAWDIVDILYQKFPAAGTAAVRAGGTQIGTLDRNAPEGSMVKATFTAPSIANHAFELELLTGTMRIVNVRFRRSDRKQIELLNAGWVGANIVDGKMSGNFFSPTFGAGAAEQYFSPYNTMLALGKVDVCCMYMGGNEYNSQTDLNAFIARYTQWADAAATLGATIVVFTPIAEAGYIGNNGAAFVEALRNLAATKGWMLVDCNKRFGPYDASSWTASGDTTHISAMGHQDLSDFALPILFGR